MSRVQLRLVNVSEAARLTGVPRSTISGWIRGEELHRAGLAADDTALYDLAAVRELAATRPRRRRRSRSTRRT